MTSIVVLITSIITIVAITGKAANLKFEKDFPGKIEIRCPWLESAEYEVSVTGLTSSLNGGCGFVDYNNSLQSFDLWFGSVQNGGPNCHAYGLAHFHFHCLSKSASPLEGYPTKGQMFIKLNDDPANKTEGQDSRCALYVTYGGISTIFMMAISGNSTCDGLSDMLYYPQLTIPKNKGSMLLIFNRTRPDSPFTSAETTTESIDSISKRFERRGYILQNFGNRPNPFRRTNIVAIQGSGIREQQHALLQSSDGDGKYGSVMDLLGYGLQSNVNGKDNTNAPSTDKDTNRLSRPLEIKHTQRRRRSKTDVTVLAGSNPFALILANRVHNNNTGSIKPLGLWDQIVRLFKN